MDSRDTIKKRSTNQKKTILLVFFLSVVALLLALLLRDSRNHKELSPLSSFSPLHPFIRKACPKTLYPSLCFMTLSALPVSKKNSTRLHLILKSVINQTFIRVKLTRREILKGFKSQELSKKEKNALDDCMEMIDQTIYELKQVTSEFTAPTSSSVYAWKSSYSNAKTLLSAAMTNQNTCIDGFSDPEEFDSNSRKSYKEHLQNLLTPVSQMISNNLAMIKYVESRKQRSKRLGNPQRSMITKARNEFQDWRKKIDRKLMETGDDLRQNVTVASDGSGRYRSITEALLIAPNMSRKIYVIRIKAGIYQENVWIPREKTNIMLVGDGMNSTIITGSRNFADGFSPFASATLTVIGDKFLARELTIINKAGPEKHQAVALRVTSNAAFYRCEIISHQDTLYAHSLRQLYRECLIQGTIDFIFGNAAAVFENCLILVRKPILGQSNMITAQGREDPNQNTGISLQNCTIEAAPEFNASERRSFSTYLGRPWRNYSRTIIMDSYIGDLIHPQGWSKWNQYSNVDTVDYIEYRNKGPGSDTQQRVSWAGYRRNCSEDVARQFTVGVFLHGADDWLQSTVLSLFGKINKTNIVDETVSSS